MPATASSRRTTPRSRPISRPRSRRPGRTVRPTTARRGPARRRGELDGPDTIVILDFGSQFAQLIARRVRELNVYSELLPHDTPWAEIERRKPKAVILSGGPNSVYDVGAPMPDSRRLERPDPGPRHLLRRPADGPRARWRRARRRQARVRPGERHDHRGGRPVQRPRAGAAGLDEPRRLDHPAARGLPVDRPDRLVAAGRVRRPEPRPVRDPVPPRGRPHAQGPRHPAQLRRRDRRRPDELDAGQLHRLDRRRDPAPGSTATPGQPTRTGW